MVVTKPRRRRIAECCAIFPRIRATWRNLGRVLYLDGRFEEALEALDGVLAIDPEDRVAHYHRMLSLRALGREDEALVAEQAYQYYQIDESGARADAPLSARRIRTTTARRSRSTFIRWGRVVENLSVEGARGEFLPCLAPALGRLLG